jgi:phenylalanyl-tRNA synthetase beta chain
LLLEIVGGECGPVIEVTAPAYLPKRAPIMLRHARVARLLGTTVPAAKIAAMLARLGMQVRTAAGGWRVTPPSYRFDVAIEADLIEEIARVVGYESLPSALPPMRASAVAVPETRIRAPRIRHLLVDRDYQEVITYSFVDPDLQALVQPGLVPARLANPIASNMAVMRTSLWPGLLQAVLYNQNRQQGRLRFFELGMRYLPGKAAVQEEAVLAGVVAGPAVSEQWGAPARAVDFFDLKGDVDALVALTGASAQFAYAPANHPALHPGQAAEISREGHRVGLIGALHPQVQAKLGLAGPVFVFELAFASIQQARVPIFHELSKFPSIRRDLALIIDEAMPAARVLALVREVAGELLVNLNIFDEYRGEGIDSGRKSLGLTLTLQDFSRTLKEEVVEAIMAKVVSALQAGVGAQLRQ